MESFKRIAAAVTFFCAVVQSSTTLQLVTSDGCCRSLSSIDKIVSDKAYQVNELVNIVDCMNDGRTCLIVNKILGTDFATGIGETN